MVVPADTMFADIVATALNQMGYPPEVASTARGSILIKNWKPMPVDSVPENTMMCTADVLGDLTSLVTLRILIVRQKPTVAMEIKDKLLQLLVMQSHPVLRSTGCPLDEVSANIECQNGPKMSGLNIVKPYPGRPHPTLSQLSGCVYAVRPGQRVR